ncbi:ribonuclease P protein component [Brochothrix campestris]|uniref:Ribonuclease P protein component n=1 Tax=Brochothrix campestris FSL F6-1037 TaxID=1265861 RepID=W7D991_9LIST|nr:ribonuclease P protein component [Brochothrix campestris]EUJ41808.1 ribonuclease P [Brochothrix campestris FSL F6-1037]
MKKVNRVKRNEDFQTIFKNGFSSANRQFVVYVNPQQQQDHFRLGLSVSKKLGDAHLRNYIKRCIRHVMMDFDKDQLISQHIDIVIIARKPAATMTFHEMKASLEHVLKLAKVYKHRSK